MTRGNSPSERDPSALTRMPATLMAEVEAWATANDVTRSDAICRLVELGLMAKGKANPGKCDASQGIGCHSDRQFGRRCCKRWRSGQPQKPAAERTRRVQRGAGRSAKGKKMRRHRAAIEPPKQISSAEREARKAFREVGAKTAMSDHEIAQTAFSKNRERLKAERLAREAAATPLKASPSRKNEDKPLERRSHRGRKTCDRTATRGFAQVRRQLRYI